MPKFLQGDILKEGLDKPYDAAFVFGHCGLNEMAGAWEEAQRRVPAWESIRNPFDNNCHIQQTVPGGTPLWWFVEEKENHGMTDEQLRESYQGLFENANQHGAKNIITNGISDVDHGISTEANRLSDDNRVRVIIEMMTSYKKEGFDVTLISLNDAYIRFKSTNELT
jgi:hypothetical protein